MTNQTQEPGLFIGIDWADQKHDIYVIDRNGKGSHRELEHSPENIDAWVGEMLKLADGRTARSVLNVDVTRFDKGTTTVVAGSLGPELQAE